jgi:hypothetical protein
MESTARRDPPVKDMWLLGSELGIGNSWAGSNVRARAGQIWPAQKFADDLCGSEKIHGVLLRREALATARIISRKLRIASDDIRESDPIGCI